ncbi:MAG: hypothetical protein NTV29_13105 [Planctomycetota bacterium]|nr:hypothetical protein [Planctomycetota bacterium]
MNKLPFQAAWILVSLTLVACNAMGFETPKGPLASADKPASKSLPLQVYILAGQSNMQGSAKILGGVGKGLAEAMAELKQLKK